MRGFGSVKVTGDGSFPGKGRGMVKIIWRHGEKSAKDPALQVQRADVLAMPEVVRTTPSVVIHSHDDGKPVRWEWRRVRHDGSTVVYTASRFSATDHLNHIVSVHVDGRAEMRKAAMSAGGDLFGPIPQLPDWLLTIEGQSVMPLVN